MTKTIELFWKQIEIRDILTIQENPILELLIGWGAWWSKTYTWSLFVLTMCLNYPWVRYWIGRSKMKTLKATTLKTLTKIMDDIGLVNGKDYKITWSNDTQTPNTIKFSNGSEILMLDLKYYPSLDPDFDDLWSLELTWGFIDEAVQITEKAYQVFSSRIWRRKNEEYWLKPMLLLSCNPWKNRVYNVFYKPQKAWTIEPHKKFIQILAKDNPFCPKWYIEKLSLMPDWPMKQRLYYGNREYDDDENKIYNYRDIQSLFTNPWLTTWEKFIITDVAWTGKDDTIITVRDWRKIIDYIIEEKSTPESVKNRMLQKQIEYNVKLKNMIYDWSWLWRWLSGLGCEIFQGWSKPIKSKDATIQENEVLNKTFLNLRSQCFFLLAPHIKNWDLSINISDEDLKTRIMEELDVMQARKVEKDWPLQVIPKEEIKKIIWRSPDFADVISMRVYFELIEREEPNFY